MLLLLSTGGFERENGVDVVSRCGRWWWMMIREGDGSGRGCCQWKGEMGGWGRLQAVTMAPPRLVLKTSSLGKDYKSSPSSLQHKWKFKKGSCHRLCSSPSTSSSIYLEMATSRYYAKNVMYFILTTLLSSSMLMWFLCQLDIAKLSFQYKFNSWVAG